MKLLDKINRLYLFASIALFTIGGLIFYYALVGSIEDETVENLYKEKNRIVAQLKTHTTKGSEIFALGQGISLTNTNLNKTQKDRLENILFYDRLENESIAYKKLIFYQKIDHRVYKISILKSSQEYDDFQANITQAILLPLFIVLTLLFFFNKYYYSKNIWHPFYDLLNKLKKFDAKKGNVIMPQKTGVAEFDEFYEVASALTQKIQDDYSYLKEFTENTSHELQTPLAIIKSKVELLIQDETLSNEQIIYIKSIYNTVGKMAKINDGLLLLAKIDNIENFDDNQRIYFKKLIEEKLILFEDFIIEKKISITLNIDPHFKCKMSLDLAKLLLTNLLSNAIKYNLPANGVINITLENNILSIANSGKNSNAALNKYFIRFKKSNINNNSVGIGMSIVKKICDIQKFNINYTFSDALHCVSITMDQEFVKQG